MKIIKHFLAKITGLLHHCKKTAFFTTIEYNNDTENQIILNVEQLNKLDGLKIFLELLKSGPELTAHFSSMDNNTVKIVISPSTNTPTYTITDHILQNDGNIFILKNLTTGKLEKIPEKIVASCKKYYLHMNSQESYRLGYISGINSALQLEEFLSNNKVKSNTSG